MIGVTSSKKKSLRKKVLCRRSEKPVMNVLTKLDENILKQFVEKTCETGIGELILEFIELRINTQISKQPQNEFKKNKERNRENISLLDESRVVLKYPDGSNQDYIHASWVKSGDVKRFICAQAPKTNTIDDFWRMVWQEKVEVIVMLCCIEEDGFKKCEQYWDEENELSIIGGKLKVKVKEGGKEVEPGIWLTRIEVVDDKGETRYVDHWQWKAWPDRSVPESAMSVFRLINRLQDKSPIIVHCSAGIGRTGTLVALDIGLRKIKNGEKLSFDTVIREIRTQRLGAVQSDEQYVFIHRAIIELAMRKKICVEDCKQFIEEYNNHTWIGELIRGV